MPADDIIDMREIEFSYGAVPVLFGVDLRVRRGEMLALLGTNGAGKSTLLRVLAGLARPAAGTIRFDGDDVTGCDAVAMVEKGLVLLPGGRAVFPDMTVDENLDIGAHVLRRDRTRAAARRSSVLELFPQVAARRRSLAGRLSGGEQQQLALAKALLLEPRVLCIDELSLGLAPVVVEDLLARLRALHDGGTTVVLVEQSLNVAASLCERAVFLEKGTVRFEGRTTDLLERDDIARAVFLGREAS